MDRVPCELGVLGEVPREAAVPLLARVLGDLVALVDTQGHGAAESHGYCSTVAAVAEGSQ